MRYIVIGDYGVGKSSFIQRLKGNSMEDAQSAVGIEFHLHFLNVDGRPIKLRIGDFPASKPQYRATIRSLYVGAVGAIIVYDITRRETFDRIPSLAEEARRFSRPNLTIILVGNKCDLENERAVSKEEGEQFAEQNGLLFVEASAATTQNVEEAFVRTAAIILQKIQAGITDAPRK